MDTIQELVLPALRDLAALSLKASVLACAVALLCLLPRRWLSPTWRHVLWCAVFARLLLPDVPVAGWSWNVNRLLPNAMMRAVDGRGSMVAANVTNDERLQAGSEGVPLGLVSLRTHGVVNSAVPSDAAVVAASVKNSVPGSVSQRGSSWLSLGNVVAVIWLTGAIAWWLALAAAWWRFRRRTLLHASEAGPAMQAVMAGCLREAEIRRWVHLKQSDPIAGPMVCGVVRPVILIPRALETSLPEHELRLLLLHELGHVKRRDTLIQVIASLLLGLHWWNPMAWFAWRRLRHEAEAATDAWVLRRTGPDTAPSYGAMLLDLASRACAAGVSILLMPSLIGATSHGRRLRQRLIAITGHRPTKRWTGMLGAAVLGVLAMTGFSQEAPASKPQPEVKPAPKAEASPRADAKGIPSFVKIKVTSASTGLPLSGCTIDSGSVNPENPEKLPVVWTVANARIDGAEYTLQPSTQIERLWQFRVRHQGYTPVATATVDPKTGPVINVVLQEGKPLPITVLNKDGTPAAKARVIVGWNARWRVPLFGLMGRLTEVSLSRRHLEFNGFTDEDGRCELPACADDATVLVVGAKSAAAVDFSDVVKNPRVTLGPYENDEERFVMAGLPPAPGAPAPGHVMIKVMYEGKPVPAKRVSLFTTGDRPGALPGDYLGFVDGKGVVRHEFAPGTRFMQIGWRTEEGVNCFGPVITTEITSGVGTELTTTLQPGVRIAGRLAEEVPRPVKEARIFAFVSGAADGEPGKITWTDEGSLREDGTFEFPSLPPGHMRFLVLADGWTTPFVPTGKVERDMVWSAGGVMQSRNDLVIPMLPTATCEVTVQDAAGQPAPGAVVTKSNAFTIDGFYSHVLFFDGAGSFMLAYPTALEVALTDKKWVPRPKAPLERMRNDVDAQGRATLRGLPPLGDAGNVLVMAPGFDFKTTRNASASAPLGAVQPGQAIKLTVSLKP